MSGMLSSLDSHSLPPRARAAQQLRRWINDGTLSPGSRLPAETRLAQQMGIARGTLRQALRELADAGLVEPQKNRGHLVVGPQRSRLLASTILVLGLYTETHDPIPGYLEAVDAGAMGAIRDSHRNALSVHPRLFGAERAGELAAGSPLGAVCCVDPLGQEDLISGLMRLRAAKVPVAMHADGPDLTNFDRVIGDHASGSAALTEQLIAAGRRRILRVWPEVSANSYWLQERDRGHLTACARNGVTALPPLYYPTVANRGDVSDAAGFDRRVRQMCGFLVDRLRGPNAIDAIMVCSDSGVAEAYAAARLCGLQPQRDLDVVGYDNYWHLCWERAFEATPPLATVDKDNAAIGAAMVDLIDHRLRSDKADTHLRVIPGRIVTADELV
ncbi:MAG: GntR family transcriptional regulator [Planctomycetota bacterium]|nr:GntR family transcriptional regulator [Planctomycetota bacterium]